MSSLLTNGLIQSKRDNCSSRSFLYIYELYSSAYTYHRCSSVDIYPILQPCRYHSRHNETVLCPRCRRVDRFRRNTLRRTPYCSPYKIVVQAASFHISYTVSLELISCQVCGLQPHHGKLCTGRYWRSRAPQGCSSARSASKP